MNMCITRSSPSDEHFVIRLHPSSNTRRISIFVIFFFQFFADELIDGGHKDQAVGGDLARVKPTE